MERLDQNPYITKNDTHLFIKNSNNRLDSSLLY